MLASRWLGGWCLHAITLTYPSAISNMRPRKREVTYDYPKIPPEGKRVVFRAWRTDPVTGKRLYARDYGLRAWPIHVYEDGR